MAQTIMTTHNYSTFLQATVKWTTWMRVVQGVGDACNRHKDRFDKADILEQAIDICSDGKLKWVDEIGRDFHDTANNVYDEFKYGKDSLLTKRGIPKRHITFKIKNSLGATHTPEISNPANFYILAQQNAVAVISYEEMKPYLHNSGDGVVLKIPGSELEFVIQPTEYTTITVKPAFCYLEEKRAMQRRFINSILESSPSGEMSTETDTTVPE